MVHLFEHGALFWAESLLSPACHRRLNAVPSGREMKTFRVQTQRSGNMFAGLEEHRLFGHAFLDRLLFLDAITGGIGDKMISGTIFKPGPDVWNSRANRCPLLRDKQGRVADVRDAVFQLNFVVRLVALFFGENSKRYAGAGNKDVPFRDRRRRNQKAKRREEYVERRSLHADFPSLLHCWWRFFSSPSA